MGYFKNQDPQLYTLINQLPIEDRDEKILLVGYSIIDSLVNFNSNSGGLEKKHDEVRSVHEGLGNAIKVVSLNSHIQDPAFNYLCERRVSVESWFKDYNQEKTLNSKLLASLLYRQERISEPIIRKLGIKLTQSVESEGKHLGARNILLGDYRTIECSIRDI